MSSQLEASLDELFPAKLAQGNESGKTLEALRFCCHMSVRQYSLYNLVPGTNGGVLSLLRVLAQLKTKVSLLGVSATIQSHFSLGLRGHRFRRGSYRFWDFLHDSYILRHSFS